MKEDAVAMAMALWHFAGQDGKWSLYLVTSTISFDKPQRRLELEAIIQLQVTSTSSSSNFRY
jgi:hypothetical protein